MTIRTDIRKAVPAMALLAGLAVLGGWAQPVLEASASPGQSPAAVRLGLMGAALLVLAAVAALTAMTALANWRAAAVARKPR